MKKEKVLSIILGLAYYAIGIIGFFYLSVFALLFGVIGNFSNTIFCICFLVLPIIVLFMPIILKFTLKKEFYKSILWSLISVAIYFVIIFATSFGISKYMSEFTFEKWNNEEYSNLRYLMLNSLEEKNDFIGMNKEEVIEILGKESDHGNRIYYFVGSQFLTEYFYCLEYDENNVITKFYVEVD